VSRTATNSIVATCCEKAFCPGPAETAGSPALTLRQNRTRFDLDWQNSSTSRANLVDEHKHAVDTVVKLRHTVSHGRFASVTTTNVLLYYDRSKQVGEVIA